MDIHGHNPDSEDPYRTLGMALARVISPAVLKAAGLTPDSPVLAASDVSANGVIDWPAADATSPADLLTDAHPADTPDLDLPGYDIFAGDGEPTVAVAEAGPGVSIKTMPSMHELERMSPEDLALVELPSIDELERMPAAEAAVVETLVRKRILRSLRGEPDLDNEETVSTPAGPVRDMPEPGIAHETTRGTVISTDETAGMGIAEPADKLPASDPQQAVEAPSPEQLRRRLRRGRKAAKAAIERGVESTVAAFDGLAAPPLALAGASAPESVVPIPSVPDHIAAEEVTVLIGDAEIGTANHGNEKDGDGLTPPAEPVVVEEIPIIAAALRLAERIPQLNKQDPRVGAIAAEREISGQGKSQNSGNRLMRMARSRAGIIGLTVLLAAGAGIQQAQDGIFKGDRPPAASSDKPAPSLERLREIGVPSTPAGKWVPAEVSRFNEVISKLQNDQALNTYLESKGWQPWYIEPRLVQACVLVLSGGDLNFKADDGRTGLTLVDEAWAREQMADYNPGDPSHALFALMLKLNERYVAAFETGKYTEPQDRKKLIRETILGELKDQDPLDTNRQRLELLAQWVPELDSQWLQDSGPAYDRLKEAKANKK